jgi:hypothetical protein
MTKENQSFTLYIGQTAEVTVNVDEAGSTNAQSLAGADLGFWMTSDRKGGSSDAALRFYSSDGMMSTTDVDGSDDGIKFRIESSDSAQFSPGTYYYEIWAKDASGNSAPVTIGQISVKRSAGWL